MSDQTEKVEALGTVVEAVLDNDTGLPVTNENDVAIAAIEAERDVTIAAIHADQVVQQDESYNEARVEVAEIEAAQENDLWQTIHHLTQVVETMQGQLLTMQTPPVVIVETDPLSSLEAEATIEAMAETLEETNGTPNSTTQTDEQTPMEHSPSESDAENPIQAVAQMVAAPIIRLV